MIYPRYKIHQLASQPGQPMFDTLSNAAKLLRRMIMTPSMVLVWVFGVAMLVANPALLSAGWLHAKLVLVVAMTGMHGFYLVQGKRIDTGVASVDARRLRLLNEVPFLLLIGIVILVVVRPF